MLDSRNRDVERCLKTAHSCSIFSCTLSLCHFSLISQLQVNIIPIIAKSDAISKSELAKFKIKITSELVSNGVQIYQFPTDDESVAEINSTMNVSLMICLMHCLIYVRDEGYTKHFLIVFISLTPCDVK